jgi:2-oxoglutarate ferredoxin oxidoreductase subunit alpha
MSSIELMKGNEAVAEAAVLAGCRFYSAYPITPQNELPAYMSKRMPEAGGVFIQAESELAAVSMLMGAAATGVRSMTSTSSPGMSLKQEGISYLAGCELPCVIVNIMRGGPGLGNISGAQGDYFQATRGGGNGDYHTIVLAPASVQELADMTVLAFDLSDKYRIPVILLGDGYLGQMSEAVTMPQPSNQTVDKSDWVTVGCQGRKPHVIASIRLNPDDLLEQHVLKLKKTWDRIKETEARYETWMTDDADYLLTAYGTSARLCRKAIKILREKGIKAGLFRPITLWPWPYEELAALATGKKKILTVELSLGQMVQDVRLAAGKICEVDFLGRPGGMLPEVDSIVERVVSYG